MPTVPRVQQRALQTPFQQSIASPNTFGASAAKAMTNLGGSLEQASNVTSNIILEVQNRKNGLARDSDDNAYAEALNERFREMQSVGDFSDEAIAEAQTFSRQVQDQILSAHKGGPASLEQLRVRMDSRRLQFEDDLAVQNISDTDKRLKQRIGQKISSVVKQVTEDATVVLPDITPKAVLQPHFDAIDRELDFLGLSEQQKELILPVAREEIARSIFSPLIANGQFERARDFLQHPDLAEVLQPAARREIADRIAQAEIQLQEAQNEGERFLQTAQTILGPNATPQQVRDAAAQMAGITQQGNFDIIEVGDAAVVFNQDTGEIVKRLEGFDITEPTSHSDVSSFRSQYIQLSGEWNQIRDSYARLRGSLLNPGPGSDVALIRSYMKMIDPGSVVRESEAAEVAAIGSFGERVKRWGQQLLEGDQLTPEMRREVAVASHALFQQQMLQQQVLQQQWQGIAGRQFPDINPNTAAPDFIGPVAEWTPVEINEETGTPDVSFVERAGREIDELVDFFTPSLQETPSERLGPTGTVEGAIQEAERAIGNVIEFLPSIEEVQQMSQQEFVEMLDRLDPTVEELAQLKEAAPELWKTMMDKAFGEEEAEDRE